uniref:Pectate lyase n=1 Tax=Phytophthora ramorum TaxID=164328 RepID=H3H0A2_PHYRM
MKFISAAFTAFALLAATANGSPMLRQEAMGKSKKTPQPQEQVQQEQQQTQQQTQQTTTTSGKSCNLTGTYKKGTDISACSTITNAIVMHSDYSKSKGGYTGSATSQVQITGVTVSGLTGSATNLYDIVANSKVVSGWEFSGVTVSASVKGKLTGLPNSIDI